MMKRHDSLSRARKLHICYGASSTAPQPSAKPRKGQLAHAANGCLRPTRDVPARRPYAAIPVTGIAYQFSPKDADV
jgi:hypothetical protein